MALFFFFMPALLSAQTEGDEGELERVGRDQSRVATRLDSLRDKMARLADRYEDEGRSRNAELLRDALERFEMDDLMELSFDVSRSLELGQLSTIEMQDEIVGSLESILAVLRDRRDVEDLEQQAGLAREGAMELGFLAEAQRRLLEETFALTDRPELLVEDALGTVREIEEDATETETQAKVLQETDAALGLGDVILQLAREERALARGERATVEQQAALEAALAIVRDELEGVIDLPSEELTASARAGRAVAQERGAEAAVAMAKAREALKSDLGDDGSTPREGSSQSGGGLESSESQTAASELMEEAADQLDAMSAALDQSERSIAAARNRARAMAMAAARDATDSAEKLDGLAQRLEAIEPEAGPELLDRTRELLRDLARREEALAGGETEGASRPLDLAALFDLLEQRRAQRNDVIPPVAEPEQFQELATRQTELAEKTRELLERLEDLPDQAFSETMQGAQSSQEQAATALRERRAAEASVREQEAAERLEEAASQLAGDQQRYEQLRQDEVLYRLEEDLASLLDRQRAISIETQDIDAGRGDLDRLGRSQRRAIARLSSTETDLARSAEGLGDAVRKDGAISFTFALDALRDDLHLAAEKLGDEQTGWVVQTVQKDVESRLEDLLAVLDEETTRRQNQMEEPEEGSESQGDSGPPPLVPRVAELLLIKRMEEMQLARLESFVHFHPEVMDEEGFGPIERELLGRWYYEHERVTQMFEDMLPEEAEAVPFGAVERRESVGEDR